MGPEGVPAWDHQPPSSLPGGWGRARALRPQPVWRGRTHTTCRLCLACAWCPLPAPSRTTRATVRGRPSRRRILRSPGHQARGLCREGQSRTPCEQVGLLESPRRPRTLRPAGRREPTASGPGCPTQHEQKPRDRVSDPQTQVAATPTLRMLVTSCTCRGGGRNPSRSIARIPRSVPSRQELSSGHGGPLCPGSGYVPVGALLSGTGQLLARPQGHTCPPGHRLLGCVLSHKDVAAEVAPALGCGPVRARDGGRVLAASPGLSRARPPASACVPARATHVCLLKYPQLRSLAKETLFFCW